MKTEKNSFVSKVFTIQSIDLRFFSSLHAILIYVSFLILQSPLVIDILSEAWAGYNKYLIILFKDHLLTFEGVWKDYNGRIIFRTMLKANFIIQKNVETLRRWYLMYNITDMPKEHCCSVLFISKTHAKNISVLPKKQLSRFKKVIRLVQIWK